MAMMGWTKFLMNLMMRRFFAEGEGIASCCGHNWRMIMVMSLKSLGLMRFLFVFLLCCNLFAYNMGFLDPDEEAAVDVDGDDDD